MNADIKTVKALADVLNEKSLTRIEVKQGDLTILLEKSADSCGEALPITATSQPVASQRPFGEDAPDSTQDSVPKEPGKTLDAPLVGIAYTGPEPGAEPFVQMGSRVKKGQTLCIIEAMKVMNEFQSPEDGVIAEICFEDSALVEYGQPLFRLQ